MITVEWDNPEKTIILWTIKDALTANEYSAALRRSSDLAQSVDHYIGVVMDMRQAGGLPKNGLLLSRQVVQEIPDNIALTVLVSNSSFWEKMWTIVSRFYPSSHITIKFSASIDEAYTMMYTKLSSTEEDTTLPMAPGHI